MSNDATTPNFNLLKPALGSYYGSWHTPVNSNMDLIDAALKSIKTHSKTVQQAQMTEEGTTWYSTALKTLFLHNGTSLVSLVTSDKFIFSIDEQHALKDGFNSVTDLHSHPGYSTKFFKVKDPNSASTTDELNNKQYYAIPFKLFDDTRIATNNAISNVQTNLNAQTNKLNGISSNGVDLSIGNVSASGSIYVDKGLTVKVGSSTISIGTTSASGSLDIIASDTTPINFKSSNESPIEVRVNNNKVWTSGNQGKGSGLISDKIDDCDVDNTKTDNLSLWTSQKVYDFVTNAIAALSEVAKANTLGNKGGPYHDAAYFASAQALTDHKTSTDHDSRYLKTVDAIMVPVGGIISFDSRMIAGGMSSFDGNGTGIGALANFQICNGYNGTPDLRDRFILGSGPNSKIANIGDTGGEQEHKLTTEEMPYHVHPNTTPTLLRDSTSGGDQHYYGSLGNSGGAGGDKPHNTMPPYYALLFIARYK